MKNFFIKSKGPDHGAKIIRFLQSIGCVNKRQLDGGSSQPTYSGMII